MFFKILILFFSLSLVTGCNQTASKDYNRVISCHIALIDPNKEVFNHRVLIKVVTFKSKGMMDNRDSVERLSDNSFQINLPELEKYSGGYYMTLAMATKALYHVVSGFSDKIHLKETKNPLAMDASVYGFKNYRDCNTVK